ncbi:fibroblast growth factor 1 [Phthorimaea operculella granulovirus]|uniref:Fibroblast growth factor 1 n=1 Tax=Phthorimaea operculella granulovirus TaxID=192584 RepID=Q8JRZ0_9BBAC|nr:fibroblast growth factor 1 [Phthorimaea operculella granulovirus]AAM70267.1 fibroblast growth factor 1 [Phthorimaea operculella granulovirus]ANY57458.1 fibroblast growth factor 1 [Phthorimaea operculella granulovirus]QBH65904.1 fibroblast growth factor 1 [Phthorimaea operculella granulovirus]QBH66034.1 fibroblast growth factor 1 [Phthorimaea operculella granulovirus]QBH66164.1 fibroblast growth factor 1 [Phthorimaea operculella granulovirus]
MLYNRIVYKLVCYSTNVLFEEMIRTFSILMCYCFINVSCVGIIEFKATKNKLCKYIGDETIYPRSDNRCAPIHFNLHKYNNNLVINFKSGACKFLCIDRCGQLYHNSVFHTEDCLLTTAAFENVDTLSVNRKNYSDFIAADAYMMPVSFSNGDHMQRMHKYLALEYKIINNNISCPLLLTPSKTTYDCVESSHRYDNIDYKERRHYRDYSWWRKLLIMIGYEAYTVPRNNTLSFIEYKN